MSLTKPPSGHMSSGRHVLEVAESLRLAGADDVTAQTANDDFKATQSFWKSFMDK